MTYKKKFTPFCLLAFALLNFGNIAVAHAAEWQEERAIMSHDLSVVDEFSSSCWNYHHIFEKITRSIRLTRDSCYLEAGILNTRVWMKVKIRLKRTDADKRAIRFNVDMLEGSIKQFQTKLKLTKMDQGRTLVGVRMKADIGLPGFLTGMIDHKIKSMLRHSLRRLNDVLNRKRA